MSNADSTNHNATTRGSNGSGLTLTEAVNTVRQYAEGEPIPATSPALAAALRKVSATPGYGRADDSLFIGAGLDSPNGEGTFAGLAIAIASDLGVAI
jgi:hypothetical protein